MITNLHKYRNDLDKLITYGVNLVVAMALKDPNISNEFREASSDIKEIEREFKKCYHRWYSEAHALISFGVSSPQLAALE